eukprot:15051027-Alexandrium_andersonii.AAC.1
MLEPNGHTETLRRRAATDNRACCGRAALASSEAFRVPIFEAPPAQPRTTPTPPSRETRPNHLSPERVAAVAKEAVRLTPKQTSALAIAARIAGSASACVTKSAARSTVIGMGMCEWVTKLEFCIFGICTCGLEGNPA